MISLLSASLTRAKALRARCLVLKQHKNEPLTKTNGDTVLLKMDGDFLDTLYIKDKTNHFY